MEWGSKVFVVVATSPAVVDAVTVGPFRTRVAAKAAAERIVQHGYDTEVCELIQLSVLDESAGRLDSGVGVVN